MPSNSDSVQPDSTADSSKVIKTTSERYNILSQLSSDYAYMMRIEADGTLTHEWVTGAFERITGFKPSELQTQNGWLSLVHPDDQDNTLQQIHAMLDPHLTANEIDCRIVTKWGEIRYLSSQNQAVWDEQAQRVARIYGIVRDISAHHIDKQALIQSNRLLSESRTALARLIQQTPLGIQVFDCTGLCIDCNEAHLELFGLNSRDELVGNYNILNDPLASKMGTAAAFRQALRGEIAHLGLLKFMPHDADLRFARFDSHRTIDVTIFPVLDENGNVTSVVGLNNDVTASKKIEEELRESKRLIERVTDTSPHLTYVYDIMDLRSIFQNRDIAQLLGYSPEKIEAMGNRRLEYLMPRNDFERLQRLRSELVDTNNGHVLELVTKLRHAEGQERWYHLREVVFLRNQDGSPRQILGTLQDITDFYKAQETLHLQNRAIHSSTLSISINDFRHDNHPIIYVNPAFEALTGYSAKEAIGQSYDFLRVHRGDQDIAQKVEASVAAGTDCTVTIRNYRKDGSLFWNELHLSPVYDEGETLTHYISFQKDITARVEAEEALQRSKDELEKRVSERTAELGQAYDELKRLDSMKSKFVSDVSHELRHPLSNLRLRVYLLEHDNPDKHPQHLEILKSQVELLNQMVEDILQLSRLEVGKHRINFAPVNLNAIAEQIIIAYQPRIEASHLKLHFQATPNLPTAFGIHNYLSQAISNLLSNAITYTPAGEIWVRTYPDSIGKGVFLQVEDTGIGISQDDQQHVFERFYRGKSVRQTHVHGTGLGLGIVKEIVDLHQGKITVQSELDKGSCFTIWLPIADTSPASP